MSHRIMLVLAGLLAIGAVGMLYFGSRLSSNEQAAQVVAPAQPPVVEYDVVAAASDLPRGVVITEADLKLTRITEQPGARFVDMKRVVGEITRVPVAADTVIEPVHLIKGGAIARMLYPGERAVAVKVDEVIGTGGFIQPEDYVDVLLYLRGNFEDLDQSQAQVVLRKVRVLAFGEQLIGEPINPEQAPPPEAADKPVGVVSKVSGAMPAQRDDRKEIGKRSRSAVLAITEADTSRLMLAENAGVLRLSLLPTPEGATLPVPEAPAPDGATPVSSATAQVAEKARREALVRRVHLDDLAGGGRAAPARAGSGQGAPVVTIYRGDKVERVVVR